MWFPQGFRGSVRGMQITYPCHPSYNIQDRNEVLFLGHPSFWQVCVETWDVSFWVTLTVRNALGSVRPVLDSSHTTLFSLVWKCQTCVKCVQIHIPRYNYPFIISFTKRTYSVMWMPMRLINVTCTETKALEVDLFTPYCCLSDIKFIKLEVSREVLNNCSIKMICQVRVCQFILRRSHWKRHRWAL